MGRASGPATAGEESPEIDDQQQGEADERPDDATEHHGGDDGDGLGGCGLERVHGGMRSPGPISASTDTSSSPIRVGPIREVSGPCSFALGSAEVVTMRILEKSSVVGAVGVPSGAFRALPGQDRANSFGVTGVRA